MEFGVDSIKVIDPSGFWFERWKTKEKREEFYELAGKAYFDSAISRRCLPDQEKRRTFIPAYLRFLYEKKFVSEKAILGALKKIDLVDGKHVAETVYVGLYEIDTTPGSPSDPSEILSIYKDGAEALLKRGEWFQRVAYTPLRAVAKDLGTEPWILGRQIGVGKYRGGGNAAKYGMKAVEVIRQYCLEKRRLKDGREFKIPPFNAILTADTYPAALRHFDKIGLETVSHLHYNYRPGLRCYLDPGVKGDEDDIACYLIMVEKRVASVVREKLQAYQPSL